MTEMLSLERQIELSACQHAILEALAHHTRSQPVAITAMLTLSAILIAESYSEHQARQTWEVFSEMTYELRKPRGQP